MGNLHMSSEVVLALEDIFWYTRPHTEPPPKLPKHIGVLSVLLTLTLTTTNVHLILIPN